MICSRRLYKGNSYEICLPLKYSGVTGVNIYTDGAVKIPVTPEISGDTLCFEITSEDLDVLADGVLRYELITDSEVSDSNSRFVVKTPDGYSAQTLDILLEEAYQSGYTAGGEGGYTSGYTDGYESGFTDGYDSKICKDEYSGLPLTFEIISGGTLSLHSGYGNYQYRKNGGEWTAPPASFSVEVGDTIQLRANLRRQIGVAFITNETTCLVNVYGNIMSLIYGDDFVDKKDFPSGTGDNILTNSFLSTNALRDASNLILPATALTNGCYNQLFANSTGLTAGPELPATILAPYCYRNMFADCTSLITPPSVLPATTLEEACYASMFRGCLIEKSPELPATTLVKNCYSAMFDSCTRLSEIKCYATDISAEGCTYRWVGNVFGRLGVSPTGTFYKNPNMTGWTTGIDGIPTINWTVQDWV